MKEENDNQNLYRPVCELRFKYIEEKISDLKQVMFDQNAMIKDISFITEKVSDTTDDANEALKGLNVKIEKLEKTVEELNKISNALSLLAKFTKPLMFAVIAAALSSIPGGLEIIKLLAGMF